MGIVPKLDWIICCSGWPLREEKDDTIKKAREKKLLRKRSPIETAIGKFKALFGFTLAQFRSQISAFASISSAILAFNIPP
jgi:hypothetical protein